jgi:hypothetical protein
MHWGCILYEGHHTEAPEVSANPAHPPPPGEIMQG